jgi:hypothetical protein
MRSKLASKQVEAVPADALVVETSEFWSGTVHKYLNDALFPNEQVERPVRAGVRGDVKRTASLAADEHDKATAGGKNSPTPLDLRFTSMAWRPLL